MEENQNKGVFPIYSKWAIMGFCLFFSPLFAGILLRSNLLDLGERIAGWRILLFSILVSAFNSIALSSSYGGIGTLAILNFLEGAIMIEFVFRKYFPHETEYPKKAIAKPLSISMMVVLLLMLLAILTGVPLEPK